MAENESRVGAEGESPVIGDGGKWTCGIRNVAMDCPVEAAWELYSDWAHWQRWWPQGEPICELREGENRKPGCLRYAEGSPGVWTYERLLEIDNANFFMSHRMEDNVFCGGVKGYTSKVQYRRTSEGKTVMEYWLCEVDPMQHMTREAFAAFIEEFYTFMAKGIESGARRLAAGLTPLPAPEEVTAPQ